jgi:hypothetical protein
MKIETVRAKVVQNDCEDCRNDLLEESKRLDGLPLAGEVVLIPTHWLNRACPHGRLGLKFAANNNVPLGEAEPAKSGEVEFETARMDATKDIGYPVREHGPYGSHPAHDDFDDESDADRPGTYPGLD